jgi:hypothetical protein
MAVGDFDNDGDLDVLVNCVNDLPQLLRCQSTHNHNWIKIKAVGVRSNRSAIGARVICHAAGRRLIAEVSSGGSYLSQNDLRVHFGLASADRATIEILWPSGLRDRLPDLPVNQIVKVLEGSSPA